MIPALSKYSNLGIHAGADISNDFFNIVVSMINNEIYSFALFPCKAIFSNEKAKLFSDQSKDCKILPHAFYDNNLASPNFGTRLISIDRIIAQSKSCLRLNMKYLNIHPGSSLKQIEKNAAILLLVASMEKIFLNTDISIVLESSCGSGGQIMADLEDYNQLFSLLSEEHRNRTEICIDTCHMFAAGYDIRDFDIFLKSMYRLPKQPFAFHLNDSLGAYNSKTDRHGNIGKAEIGWGFFDHFFASDFANILTIMETPGTTYERIIERSGIINRYEKSNC